jgi:hypothetical protein
MSPCVLSAVSRSCSCFAAGMILRKSVGSLEGGTRASFLSGCVRAKAFGWHCWRAGWRKELDSRNGELGSGEARRAKIRYLDGPVGSLTIHA